MKGCKRATRSLVGAEGPCGGREGCRSPACLLPSQEPVSEALPRGREPGHFCSPQRLPRERRRHPLQMRPLGPCAASVSAPGGWSGRGCCARSSQWTSSAARGAEEGGRYWRCSPRAASSGAFFATCTCPNCPHPRHLPGGHCGRRCGSDARLRDALSLSAQGDRSPAQGRGVPGARRAGLLRALLHRPMRVARPSWTTTYPGPRPKQGSHAAYAP